MHLLAGLALGFSLIIAIGAQNVFVLRQGIRREHVFMVATICAASDAVLIVAGVSGVGAATAAWPWLVPAARWSGALFLISYGLLAARRALGVTGQSLALSTDAPTSGRDPAAPDPTREPDRSPSHRTIKASASLATGASTAPAASTATLSPAGPAATTASVAVTCLALTWLNPHVYLDTVFLLGSVAGTHGDGRWEFALGAMISSAIWFTSLAYGARFLGRWLASAGAWRVLDAVIAFVMVALGVTLVLG